MGAMNPKPKRGPKRGSILKPFIRDLKAKGKPIIKSPLHKRFPGDGSQEDDAMNLKTGRPMWDEKAKPLKRGDRVARGKPIVRTKMGKS